MTTAWTHVNTSDRLSVIMLMPAALLPTLQPTLGFPNTQTHDVPSTDVRKASIALILCCETDTTNWNQNMSQSLGHHWHQVVENRQVYCCPRHIIVWMSTAVCICTRTVWRPSPWEYSTNSELGWSQRVPGQIPLLQNHDWFCTPHQARSQRLVWGYFCAPFLSLFVHFWRSPILQHCAPWQVSCQRALQTELLMCLMLTGLCKDCRTGAEA